MKRSCQLYYKYKVEEIDFEHFLDSASKVGWEASQPLPLKKTIMQPLFFAIANEHIQVFKMLMNLNKEALYKTNQLGINPYLYVIFTKKK